MGYANSYVSIFFSVLMRLFEASNILILLIFSVHKKLLFITQTEIVFSSSEHSAAVSDMMVIISGGLKTQATITSICLCSSTPVFLFSP